MHELLDGFGHRNPPGNRLCSPNQREFHFLGRQNRSMQSTLSMTSMPSKMRPTPDGVERAKNQIKITLIPSDDFGEIIDNAPPTATWGFRWNSVNTPVSPDLPIQPSCRNNQITFRGKYRRSNGRLRIWLVRCWPTGLDDSIPTTCHEIRISP